MWGGKGTATRTSTIIATDDRAKEVINWSSCNVKSLNGKLAHFKKILQRCEIAALQETHSVKWQETFTRIGLGFDGGVFSHFQKNARGAAILWKKPWVQFQKATIADNKGRVAGAVLENDGKRVAFMSVYAPNLDKSNQSRQEYVSWLIEVDALIDRLMKIGKTRELIMMGDCNQIMDEHLDSFSKHPTVQCPTS